MLPGIFYAVREMETNQLLNKRDWPRKLIWLLTMKNYAVEKIAMWKNGRKIRASMGAGQREDCVTSHIYQMKHGKKQERRWDLYVPKILKRARDQVTCLSSYPQHPHKIWVWQLTSVTQALGKGDEDSWNSLTTQSI